MIHSLSSTVNQKVICQNGVCKLKIRDTLNVQVWTLWPIQHGMSGLCNNVAQALPAFSHMCRRPIVVRSGCERQIVGLWKLQWSLNGGCLNLTSESCGLGSFFRKVFEQWVLLTFEDLKPLVDSEFFSGADVASKCFGGISGGMEGVLFGWRHPNFLSVFFSLYIINQKLATPHWSKVILVSLATYTTLISKPCISFNVFVKL